MKPYSFCPICEKKLEEYKLCEECNSLLDRVLLKSYKIDELEDLLIAFTYVGVGKILIKKFKFQKELTLESIIGDLMIEVMLKKGLYKNYKYISYVPMTKRDEGIRGFNQSKLLAKYIAENLDLKFIDSFRKIKNTKMQVGLDAKDRKENIKEAFVLENYSRDLIIVDDVITTGSTIIELAKVAKIGGIKKVAALIAATENSN